MKSIGASSLKSNPTYWGKVHVNIAYMSWWVHLDASLQIGGQIEGSPL